MAAASVTPTSNIFSDLFAPIPQDRAPVTQSGTSGLDRVTNYLDSTSGAWDLFRVIEHALDYIRQWPSLSDSMIDLTSRVSKVINLSGISLSIPAVFSDMNTLRKRVGAFFDAQDIAYSDPYRHQRIMQAGKGAFLSGMYLGNSLSQATMYLHHVNIVDLGKYFPVVDLVYQGTGLIGDGAELVEEAYKIDSYNKEHPRSEREKAKLEDQKWLSWMVIVKDISSIAMTVIGTVGIIFAISTASMSVVAPLMLVLTSVWLSLKIATYFYKEILEDRYTASAVAM